MTEKQIFDNFMHILSEKILLQFTHFDLAELVASLVVFHSRVAFDPVPFHIEGGIEGIKFLPEFLIEDGLFCRRAPAVLFPVENPAGDAVFDILTVDVHLNWIVAEPLSVVDCAQGRDCCCEFHAVVGGEFFAAGKFTGLAFSDYYASPAAYARVPPAAAVSVYDYFFAGRFRLHFVKRKFSLHGESIQKKANEENLEKKLADSTDFYYFYCIQI